MGRLVLILLDTHVVIWLAQDQQRISSRARDAIISSREGVQGLAVSAMTLLELARLASQKRIELTPNLEDFLRDVERRFAVLPITGRICVQAFEFPVKYPKDPSDRVIGATAVIEGLSLVTADQAIRQSKAVPTIW
jgi:PIN domain nuclease of toxin-antitoxin system